MRGDPVHLELVVDGDASTPTEMMMYTSGTDTVRVLAANEFLSIVDIWISSEVGGDFSLTAGSAGAGKYVLHGSVFAKFPVVSNLSKPFTCPKGVLPYFTGVSTHRDVCIIEGFVTKA